MGKDNTALLVIGAVIAGYFLAPKEIKDRITGGAAPGITSIDLGGITTAIPQLETGFSDFQAQAQSALFNLQLQGMRAAFDLQLAGLKNMIPALPQPQQLISGLTGGDGGGFPTIPELIEAVTGNLPIPNLPGFPDWGKDEGGTPDTGKVEGIGFGEGLADLMGNLSVMDWIFGTDIGETSILKGLFGIDFSGIGKDGREDTPEANQQTPEPRAITIADLWGGDRFFLPSGAETTREIATALKGLDYDVEVVSEAPVASEASFASYSPSAAEVSSPSSAHYGASM